MARILQPRSLQVAVQALLAEDVVALPTETVYGLAARFDSPIAVESVFRTKGRPAHDPLIVHVAPTATLESLVRQGVVGVLSPRARRVTQKLMARFWPGPLTLVLPRGRRVSPNITADSDYVALRMPAHPVFQRVLRSTRVPLVAPSANRFQGISPTRAEHVHAELGDRIRFIVDGGPCKLGIESTILWIQPNTVSLLRPGALPLEALRKVAGVPIRASRVRSSIAPGRESRHYSPSKPVALAVGPRDLLIKATALSKTFRSLGVLARTQSSADRIKKSVHNVILEVASPNGDPQEVARRLYGCMRRLDNSVSDFLLMETTRSKSGLLRAVSDRLQRAAGLTS